MEFLFIAITVVGVCVADGGVQEERNKQRADQVITKSNGGLRSG